MLHPTAKVEKMAAGIPLKDELAWFEALLAGHTALGRIGEPEEVGSVIASLLSNEKRWINAQTIEVAGGYII